MPKQVCLQKHQIIKKFMRNRNLTFYEAINEATLQSMEKDENILVIGEGVPDPKSIFGTTKNIKKLFPNRVFDMPLSENALTGICIGASLRGIKPILVHQRIDFSLLSLDQIINNAAKWFFMFNKEFNVPIVIRMIIGRGWGQGPQHSQNLQGLFAQIPGLKVVMPTTPYRTKGLLNNAIQDKNPVIFIEHRWLYNISENVSEKYYEIDITKSFIVKRGNAITIVGISFMVMECLNAIKVIEEHLDIKIELIDLTSISPLDMGPIIKSLKKTGHLIIVDSSHEIASIGHVIISRISTKEINIFKKKPKLIADPNYPSPTSHHLTKKYYTTPYKIIMEVIEMLEMQIDPKKRAAIKKSCFRTEPHDVPYNNFKGPF
jgi:acetoin:2,6-dichlorophenolindophenol oxidoreductase subunit beta